MANDVSATNEVPSSAKEDGGPSISTEPPLSPAENSDRGVLDDTDGCPKRKEDKAHGGSTIKRPKLENEPPENTPKQTAVPEGAPDIATEKVAAEGHHDTAAETTATGTAGNGLWAAGATKAGSCQGFKGTAGTGGFGISALSSKSVEGSNYFTQAALKMASGPGGFCGSGGLGRFASTQVGAQKGSDSETADSKDKQAETKPPPSTASTALFPEKYEYETGEEEETCVVQCRARLHHLDIKDRVWRSRGEGTLKLNQRATPDDAGCIHPRLVMWCTGSKRLVLNVRLWDGMAVELVNGTRVRFVTMEVDDKGATAMNTYLVTTGAADAEALTESIKARVKILDKVPSKQPAMDHGPASTVQFTKASMSLTDIARHSVRGGKDTSLD